MTFVAGDFQMECRQCYRSGSFRLSLKTKEMAKLKNIHPGEVLLEEFLVPLGISAYKLAKDINIPQTRVSEILKGNRRITADTALRRNPTSNPILPKV